MSENVDEECQTNETRRSSSKRQTCNVDVQEEQEEIEEGRKMKEELRRKPIFNHCCYLFCSLRLYAIVAARLRLYYPAEPRRRALKGESKALIAESSRLPDCAAQM